MYERRLLDSVDLPAIGATLALVVIGLLSIASATMQQQDGRAGLWRMQLLWLVIALTASVIVYLVDYRVWAEVSLALHLVVIGLLVAVLFFGREVGGNRSWLVIGPRACSRPSSPSGPRVSCSRSTCRAACAAASVCAS